METTIKKLSMAIVTANIGLLVSTFAWATPSAVISVSGTPYNFTYIYGAFSESATATLIKSQPWWTGIGSDHTSADTFALALGNAGNFVLGQPNVNPNNIPNYPNTAPFFAYDDYSGNYNHVVYQINSGNPSVQVSTSSPGPLSQSMYYAVVTSVAAVPEINGALIPQVGFLIGSLFLILGRRKENSEPVLVT